MKESQDAPFVLRFTEAFYVSQTAAENAVRSKSSFNLIHLPTAFKVDVFVSRARPFDKASMRRATREKIGTTRTLEVPIATAEDSSVSKIEWYHLAEETSERQRNCPETLKTLGKPGFRSGEDRHRTTYKSPGILALRHHARR